MNKRLIKSLALGAFAMGGGLTTLASTSCSSSSGPDKIYELSDGDLTTATQTDNYYSGFNNGVLNTIKNGGYNGIKFPSSDSSNTVLTTFITKEEFWNNTEFIKTIELPNTVNKCCGYLADGSGNLCHAIFPTTATKLIFDANQITFDCSHTTGTGSPHGSMFRNCTGINTIVFTGVTNVSSSSDNNSNDINFGNINFSNCVSGVEQYVFPETGKNASGLCRIVCPNVSDQSSLDTLLSQWKTKFKLPDKWTITNKL